MSREQATRRLLVVANETVTSDALAAFVAAFAGAQVLVVAPALSGRLAYWTGADAEARRRASRRLTECLAVIRGAGIDAEGLIGDANPMLAIADALRLFPADEIVISTQPAPQSNWLSDGVVERARRRFGLPTHHVVGGAVALAA